MKVAVIQSSYISPTETGDPDWRWGKMYDVLAVGVRRGFRFSTNLWVD